MELYLEEWGDPAAPPLVCLHGITAYGRRFRKLAEDRLAARFRVLAPDLRGHGRSGWEPPWSIATHVDDVLETLAAVGVERAVWLGHSFGGRLVVEAGARDAALVERAILLDPALGVLPQVGLALAEHERRERTYASPEAAIEARVTDGWGTPREFVEEDVADHLVPGPDGLYRFRYCQSAVVALHGELAAELPAPARVPTLLVHAPAFGLVREDQVQALRGALGPLLEELEVPGGHMVIWDAYEATADAVDRFLADTSAGASGTHP